MVTGFIRAVLYVTLISLVLTGCGDSTNSAAEAPATATIVAVIAEPTSPPTETATTPTAEPAQAAPTVEPTVEPTQTNAPPPAEPSPTTAPVESEAMVRTFRLVPESSKASYTVEEEFFNQAVNFFTAVGTTQAIEGEFTVNLEGNQVTLGDNRFVVDLRTLTSDSSRRDNRIRQQWLESNSYPLAEFVATGLEGFPETVAEGQDISFRVVGDMTIREVTRPLTFETTARLDGETITGVATTQLLMRDFGFEPPSILGMLEVTDGVTVTVEFTAVEDNNPS
jgi:polyisoprenoid-binding protein YceI